MAGKKAGIVGLVARREQVLWAFLGVVHDELYLLQWQPKGETTTPRKRTFIIRFQVEEPVPL